MAIWNFFSQNTWLNETLLLMPNYKWLGLLVGAICALLIKTISKQVLDSVKNSHGVSSRAKGFLKFLFDQPIERPLAWIITSLFLMACLDWLAIIPTLEKYFRFGAQLLLAINVVRLLYMAADAIGKVLEDFASRSVNTLDDQLVPFASKTLKLVIILLGVLMTLQNFGVNVMSLIAGLGLGGLALALAAQDTAANLFGSITIILDRPFQVGDWIKVGDTEGTVEEVGFRSTRVRTFYNSLVTIPNSIMAKEKIDNMGARPTRRIRHTLGFTYDATESQLKQFMEALKSALAQHPQIDKENSTIAFRELGDFSLQVLLNYFVFVTETVKEAEIQQEVLFEVMKLARQFNLEFAFPTQTHFQKVIPN